jgi:hypothetical protein
MKQTKNAILTGTMRIRVRHFSRKIDFNGFQSRCVVSISLLFPKRVWRLNINTRPDYWINRLLTRSVGIPPPRILRAI